MSYGKKDVQETRNRLPEGFSELVLAEGVKKNLGVVAMAMPIQSDFTNNGPSIHP